MSTENELFKPVTERSTLARAKFAPGMLLQYDDLEQLNLYTRDLSRMLFRSLLGDGVVCGLVVRVKPDCARLTVTVAPGLALDDLGDPIHVPVEQSLADDGTHGLPDDKLWVVLRHKTRSDGPRTTMCDADEPESTAYTREHDCFEIRIEAAEPAGTCDDSKPQATEDPCKCVDPVLECYKRHYAGECGRHDPACATGGNPVVLARLHIQGAKEGETAKWQVDHSVRRFIRPVLMRDPQVSIENATGGSHVATAGNTPPIKSQP